MKAINFASLDPVQQARNIAALGNTSRGDRELWNQFQENPEAVAANAPVAYAALSGRDESIEPGVSTACGSAYAPT